MGVFYNHANEIATVSTTFRVDGVPTDPDAAVLVVTDPDGQVTQYTGGQLIHSGPGEYRRDVACSSTTAGIWRYVWVGTGAASDAEPGSWTTLPVNPARYATLEELKSRLKLTDKDDDFELELALAAAQERIDGWTGRTGTGFTLAPTATTRTFTPNTGDLLFVDAIGSLDGLVVEYGSGAIWSLVADDLYELAPANAIAMGRAVEMIEHQSGRWPTCGRQRVRVTARWGWPTVPAAIKQATLLDAARLFRRKDSPEGLAGGGEFGPVRVPASDPDVRSLIAPYVIPVIA